MNQKKVAIIVGGSGLIGGYLIDMLLECGAYSQIIAIGRKRLPFQHPVLRQIVTSLDELDSLVLDVQVDHAFCCLGTTMGKAGSKEAFYRVDYQYVYNFARLAKRHGASLFSMVSAVGADASSLFYYNRVKGQIENAVSELGFSRVQIFRPSLLLGERSETRPGEDLAKWADKLLRPLMPDRYKAIHARKVAKAIQQEALSSRAYSGIITNEEMLKVMEQAVR